MSFEHVYIFLQPVCKKCVFNKKRVSRYVNLVIIVILSFENNIKLNFLLLSSVFVIFVTDI